jgi:hypothetical protein
MIMIINININHQCLIINNIKINHIKEIVIKEIIIKTE